jgi:hypothetical protein
MAFMMVRFEVDDYAAWKELFDSDPAGRRQSAKTHQIFQGVDDPRYVAVSVEFSSVDDARAFRDRLLGSGVLENLNVPSPPTVVERVEQVTY